MSEHPMAEAAALEIVRALKPIFPNAMREEDIYQQIVDRDGWEPADVENGLAYAENHGWIKKRIRGRVSAARVGIEALARFEK
jgi:hypothetical protein